MSNQWVQLTAKECAVNMAQARSVMVSGRGYVEIAWADGTTELFEDDEARRLVKWIGDQHLPTLPPALPE